MSPRRMISIWFFIGCLLTAYGVLILGAGIQSFWIPAAGGAIMPWLHLQMWWGIALLTLGLVYVIRFRPAR
jgi:hypothetical protein